MMRVRCFVSVPLIQRCYKQAIEKGSAVPAVAATDSIRILNGSHHTIADRQQVRIIQTPQTFLSEIILPAFKQIIMKLLLTKQRLLKHMVKSFFN